MDLYITGPKVEPLKKLKREAYVDVCSKNNKTLKLNFDGLVKSPKIPFSVIPSRIGVRDDGQAGIQSFQVVADNLDSGFHRSDDFLQVHYTLKEDTNETEQTNNCHTHRRW
jgi:hypothetical protein